MSSCLPLLFLPSFFPLISLPPCLAAVVRYGCCPLAAISVDHQARRRPSVLPSVKFSSRRARRSGYFVPFCRLLSCPPYVLHAAVSARRYTQIKQAYSRSCAPYLSPSVSTFYTFKKSFAFYEKNLQKKLAGFKKSHYLCTRKIDIKHLTRSLSLLYIYIGKIKSPQPVAASCGRREGQTLHCLL